MLHHIEEEESEIFEAVQECMDDAQLQTLAEEFQLTRTKMESEVEAALVK